MVLIPSSGHAAGLIVQAETTAGYVARSRKAAAGYLVTISCEESDDREVLRIALAADPLMQEAP